MAAAWRSGQKNTKPCPRCGLQMEQGLERCPHCGELDERGLQDLRERIGRERAGHKALGWKFFAVALALAAVLIVSFID